MFAGIATITLSEDDSTITGVASREGEDVSFCLQINFILSYCV